MWMLRSYVPACRVHIAQLLANLIRDVYPSDERACDSVCAAAYVFAFICLHFRELHHAPNL